MNRHSVPQARITYHPPGDEAKDLKPGDLILTSGTNLFARLIQFGQRRVSDEFAASYNHAAVVLEHNGKLAEALEWGVEVEDVTKYAERSYAVVRPEVTSLDRAQMMDFAWTVTRDRHRYGYLTVVSIVFYLVSRMFYPAIVLMLAGIALPLLGLPVLGSGIFLLGLLTSSGVYFSTPGTAICSGFAAETYVRAGAIFSTPTTHVLPSDLAEAFELTAIAPGDRS